MGRLVVVGEAFIRPSVFERLKATLLDSAGKPYKNGRNLAAGSVRLMDAAVCKERRVTFMPFAVLEGMEQEDSFSKRLTALRDYGFDVFPLMTSTRILRRESATRKRSSRRTASSHVAKRPRHVPG